MARKKSNKIIDDNKKRIYESNAKTKYGLGLSNIEPSDRIKKDLDQSYGLLSDNPVYLHTNSENFEYALRQNQNKIQSKETIKKLLNAWQVEAQVLHKYCQDQEQQALMALNLERRKNNLPPFETFEIMIQNLEKELKNSIDKNQNLGIAVLLNKQKEWIQQITELKTNDNNGRKKNLLQLEQLAQTYDKLVNLALEQGVDESNSQLDNLKRKAEELRIIIQSTIINNARKFSGAFGKGNKPTLENSDIWYQNILQNYKQQMQTITDLFQKGENISYKNKNTKRKRTANIQGKSVQGLGTVIKGLLGEKFIADNITDVFSKLTGSVNTMIEQVGKETQTGTTRDLIARINSKSEINISVKSTTIQQAASSLSGNLKQFFVQQKPDELLQLNDQKSLQLFEVYKTLQDINLNTNALKIGQYLIYSNFYVTKGNKRHDLDLFMDYFKVMALAHLNEKLFGYGKTKQQENLDTILQNIPVVTINFDGDVIIMSQLIDELSNNVEKLYNDILTKKNKLTIDYSGLSADIKGLHAVKADYIKKDKNITYAKLKSAIQSKLKEENNKIENNIKITIDYNLGGKWWL